MSIILYNKAILFSILLVNQTGLIRSLV